MHFRNLVVIIHNSQLQVRNGVLVWLSGNVVNRTEYILDVVH